MVIQNWGFGSADPTSVAIAELGTSLPPVTGNFKILLVYHALLPVLLMPMNTWLPLNQISPPYSGEYHDSPYHHPGLSVSIGWKFPMICPLMASLHSPPFPSLRITWPELLMAKGREGPLPDVQVTALGGSMSSRSTPSWPIRYWLPFCAVCSDAM